MARLTARPGGGMLLKTGGGKFLKNSAATGGMIQKNDTQTAHRHATEVFRTLGVPTPIRIDPKITLPEYADRWIEGIVLEKELCLSHAALSPRLSWGWVIV